MRDRLLALAELDQRREAILKSLLERNLLTDDLKASIAKADTITVLEDLYLPYRPKRRTRATIAKEQGLEPLADMLFNGQDSVDPLAQAAAFVDAAKGVATVDLALAGARDILAERVSDDAMARAQLRSLYWSKAVVRSKVMFEKETEGAKFKDYFDWSEPVSSIPSHRLLAIRRGEAEGFLLVRINGARRGSALGARAAFCQSSGKPAAEQVRLAVQDGYKRLLGFAIEGEMRLEAKKNADAEAIRVFSANLRELLLAPPLGRKNVLAIDPGFRTGCKVVCLDRQGKLLHHDVIFPSQSDYRVREAADTVRALCQKFQDRGHRHRQRHGGPRDRNLCSRPQIAGVHPHRDGQRKRRLHLFRLGSGARGISRPGPHGARRRFPLAAG